MQNYMMIISMRIRMQGFIVFDFADKYAEARKQLAQWLSEGKLKRKETVIQGGISMSGHNWGVKSLTTTGKIMVQVADPEAVKAKL